MTGAGAQGPAGGDALASLAVHAIALWSVRNHDGPAAELLPEEQPYVSGAAWARLRTARHDLRTAAPALHEEIALDVEGRLGETIARPEVPAADARDAELAPDPLRELVICAIALDRLRELNEEGVIAGLHGWAVRDWAWARLDHALTRHAEACPEAHGLLVARADAVTAELVRALT